MNGDGSNQRQLTSNAGINNNPAVSPDGRFIVFTSTRTGASHIWRMDIDGANAKQLTSGSTENYAQVSSDGKWVVYTLFSGKPTLWRVSIEGGEPIMVSGKSTSSPAISPDGKWIASVFWDVQPNSPPVVSVIPFEGGETLRVFDPLWGRGGQSKSDWRSLRWMPDGRGIAYALMTGGVSNVWTQPLVGGEPKQLTDFKTDNIFWFDWSRDGSQIACARGAETNDVVLISNFK
jgi:Tol biopolymer transport system component